MSSSRSNTESSQRTRLGCLAVVAIAAVLAVAANTAAAGTQANTPEPVGVAVASYAKDYSVTHHEAQRRLDRIQPLQEILASIRELESARLAGWGIDHLGTFGGWVWLTGGQSPTAAASRIADAHTDVQIRTGAAHSLKALLAAQTGLFQDVGPTGHVTGSPQTLAEAKRIVTYTDISVRANAIEIGIDPALASTVPGGLPNPGPAAVTDEALKAKITEVTQQLRDHIGVKYIVADGRGLSVHADFKGGEPVSSAEGTCTSGFAAQERGTGTYGIITAAHCTSNDTQSITMHQVTLSPVERSYGPNVDAQFQSIPTGQSHRLFDDYLCEERDPCDVTGDAPRSKMIDAYLCHYGRKTRETCGDVISIFYRPSSGCETTCNSSFVRVHGDSLKGCKGDSGGPWYYDGTAYGILSGGTKANDCQSGGKYLYFSPIQSVERILGVDILTNGYVDV